MAVDPESPDLLSDETRPPAHQGLSRPGRSVLALLRRRNLRMGLAVLVVALLGAGIG